MAPVPARRHGRVCGGCGCPSAVHGGARTARLEGHAYSVDDGPWQLGATVDGIFDDRIEELRIALPSDLSRGPHTLAVRVADAAGNVGSTSSTFLVK